MKTIPSGNLLQFAIEAMARLVRCFTVFQDGDVPVCFLYTRG